MYILVETMMRTVLVDFISYMYIICVSLSVQHSKTWPCHHTHATQLDFFTYQLTGMGDEYWHHCNDDNDSKTDHHRPARGYNCH